MLDLKSPVGPGSGLRKASVAGTCTHVTCLTKDERTANNSKQASDYHFGSDLAYCLFPNNLSVGCIPVEKSRLPVELWLLVGR